MIAGSTLDLLEVLYVCIYTYIQQLGEYDEYVKKKRAHNLR